MRKGVPGSINFSLALLVMVAVLPALLIMLYTGLEQRRQQIEVAKGDVTLLVRTMAEAQEELAVSTRQMLAMLSRLPAIHELDPVAGTEILADLLAHNPDYLNLTLTGLDGRVLISALPFENAYLGDRKHFREALASRDFAVGEYIISRVGSMVPAVAFAYPVLDREGELRAVVTAAINLNRLARFYEGLELAADSFIALTDHQGIRLLYLPAREETNPVGRPIRADIWEIARQTGEAGSLVGHGSDGRRRVIAFESVRLTPEAPPHIYVWAGIPEEHILAPANAALGRNLLLMGLVMAISLGISWLVGRFTLVAPIRGLLALTQAFAGGNLGRGKVAPAGSTELVELTLAFYEMADSLARNQAVLRENERRLAEEKERLAVTLASIGDGVVATDTTGRVLLLNEVAADLTGWPTAAATGRPLAEVFRIIDGKSGQPRESPVEQVLAAGRVTALAADTTLLARDGRERHIADSAAPIRDREGQVIGVVLVFRDISQRLRAEQELVKVKKLESVGVLAGGIAHDFNNILTAILGNINLCLLDERLPAGSRRLLQEAEKASIRARGLTQQLLTFAKGGEPIKESASLAEVVRDSAEFVLRGKQVACSFDFPAQLKPVEIDRGQISQVVQNLILNAVEAMPDGGRIEISCRNVTIEPQDGREGLAPGDYLLLEVRDSGPGMASEVLERIFDPYFTTKAGGSGLGLAISHTIIGKHGGRITAGSTPGGGSCFTIYLPVGSGPAPESVKPAQDKTAPGAPAAGPAKILVLDDEEQVREIMRLMLGRLGHQVVTAGEGREAVALYRQAMAAAAPIDLIIMDLTIPGGMGGKEAVREILALNPRALVVVASGYSSDPVLANFRDYGFSGAIAKPFRLKEIARLLNELLPTGQGKP
ncbi:ATP-binding protein [Desulfurivibrio sp. D14AmB]|uniref:ATP-binding protein n=1 Tax=Desulfurivibrio sp. D14AmB TaxID=3374370 RepID=UPI00376F4441